MRTVTFVLATSLFVTVTGCATQPPKTDTAAVTQPAVTDTSKGDNGGGGSQRAQQVGKIPLIPCSKKHGYPLAPYRLSDAEHSKLVSGEFFIRRRTRGSSQHPRITDILMTRQQKGRHQVRVLAQYEWRDRLYPSRWTRYGPDSGVKVGSTTSVHVNMNRRSDD